MEACRRMSAPSQLSKQGSQQTHVVRARAVQPGRAWAGGAPRVRRRTGSSAAWAEGMDQWAEGRGCVVVMMAQSYKQCEPALDEPVCATAGSFPDDPYCGRSRPVRRGEAILRRHQLTGGFK